MKDYLGLKDDYGVFISKVDIEDVELQENDVLISINGKKISKNVILNMLKSFALPMYSEGFTSIEYNWLPRRF